MSDETNPDTWKDFILICIYGPLLIVQVVLVLKFYNFLESTLLVAGGWILLFLFFIIGALPRYEFKKKGEVTEGKSYIHTTALVDTGIYAVVRHPQFLSWILLSFGLVLLSQYWLSAVLAIPIAAMVYVEAYRADKLLIEKFGEDYREYMRNVPRMNLLVGVLKLCERRKE